MSPCVQELNNVVSSMDEKLVFVVLNFAKNIKKHECKDGSLPHHSMARLGIAKDKQLYNNDYDFHALDKEIEREFLHEV